MRLISNYFNYFFFGRKRGFGIVSSLFFLALREAAVGKPDFSPQKGAVWGGGWVAPPRPPPVLGRKLQILPTGLLRCPEGGSTLSHPIRFAVRGGVNPHFLGGKNGKKWILPQNPAPSSFPGRNDPPKRVVPPPFPPAGTSERSHSRKQNIVL